MAAVKPKFNNRELSWLEFNQRVLDEARNGDVPLLDRLNFLSITASNLDEFFMVRVGGLELLIKAGMTKRGVAGMTPREQIQSISKRVRGMVDDQYACYLEDLEPRMRAAGIRRVTTEALTDEQFGYLQRFFEEELFPVVSPVAVQSRGDFPLLSNLGLHVGARLKSGDGGKKFQYAVIPIGAKQERFVAVPSDEGFCYVLIEDIITLFVDHLFEGQSVAEAVPFRIARNADMSAREDFAEDFLAEMQEVLDRRRQSGCVRLEIDGRVTRTFLRFLTGRLGVRSDSVYEVGGPLDLSAFSSIAFMEGFEALRYKPWPPQPSPNVDLKKSIFDELSRKTILLMHPYESFDPVLKLVQEAATDPDVLAIKQILYRTSSSSQIVVALREAAENGKYVTAVIELRARFDEAQNIEWARELERSGVQVIYGVKGLKIHAKLCMVVRREPHGIVRYMHFGTGNYNEKTARLYTDISYMTRDRDLGNDAAAFFNAVTGYSEPRKFLKVEASPMGLKTRLLALIDGEAERAKHGQKGLIMAKMNSLVHPQIIQALYRASQAGATIMLSVRGICCLCPGVKRLSENITVVSIVDRFLEHSRVFYFYRGGEERVFISSADWMPRNLDRRLELMVPIDDADHRRRLVDVLETTFSDTVKGRELLADGTYRTRRPRRGRTAIRSQEVFYRQALEAVEAAHKARHTSFEPHQPPDRQRRTRR